MLIAITGGIGAGKSVVASILKTMGYPVYDCDSRAKLLMDSNSEIVNRIECEVASEAVCDGRIDRAALSKVVCGSPA
ncbi:MAG: dephospho-CoA kinase, partial [Paramuribaculum sp.]|nr:dephospho-CoA kinase [Paramuribaculum sp.]